MDDVPVAVVTNAVVGTIMEEANLWFTAGFRHPSELLPLVRANSSQTMNVN
jgi:uncharacterized membrane protein